MEADNDLQLQLQKFLSLLFVILWPSFPLFSLLTSSSSLSLTHFPILYLILPLVLSSLFYSSCLLSLWIYYKFILLGFICIYILSSLVNKWTTFEFLIHKKSTDSTSFFVFCVCIFIPPLLSLWWMSLSTWSYITATMLVLLNVTSGN